MDDIELDQEPSYPTSHELDFISRIGTCSYRGPHVDRKKLLEGYLLGCEKRSDWCGMSKLEIINFVLSEIKKLEESEGGDAI